MSYIFSFALICTVLMNMQLDCAECAALSPEIAFLNSEIRIINKGLKCQKENLTNYIEKKFSLTKKYLEKDTIILGEKIASIYKRLDGMSGIADQQFKILHDFADVIVNDLNGTMARVAELERLKIELINYFMHLEARQRNVETTVRQLCDDVYRLEQSHNELRYEIYLMKESKMKECVIVAIVCQQLVQRWQQKVHAITIKNAVNDALVNERKERDIQLAKTNALIQTLTDRVEKLEQERAEQKNDYRLCIIV